LSKKQLLKIPRSTVGTVTEIYDYLTLAYLLESEFPYSPTTGLPIKSQTVTQMVDRIKSSLKVQNFLILAPIVRGRKGEYKKELGRASEKRISRE
jgi:excinuclease ABC subunit A